jgi:hypothetical protein
MTDKGRYYIIVFDRDAYDNIIRHELFCFPNGTYFYNNPIHINSNKVNKYKHIFNIISSLFHICYVFTTTSRRNTMIN